ncbi:MAG: hypothetical protein MJZ76_05655 [Bacteroidales bacterium]|nr:hypothetical protein [Bacteroidales bacterium]
MDTNNLTEIDERINRFLKGTMSPEEELSFKNELELDPELKARAVSQAFLVRSLQNVGKSIDDDLIRSAKSIDKPFVFSSHKNDYKNILYAAAAVIALIIVCVPLTKHYQTPPFTDETAQTTIQYKPNQSVNYSDQFNPDIFMRDYEKLVLADIADSYLSQPVNLSFSNGDAVHQAKINDLTNIFLAIIQKNDIEEHTICLESIKDEIQTQIVSDYTAYDYDVTWFLALAYLELGRRHDATQLLEEYINIKADCCDISKMQKLLDEINEI